jgi:hypothetical protein
MHDIFCALVFFLRWWTRILDACNGISRVA